MICFKINGIEIAKAENEIALMQKQVWVYNGKLNQVVLGDVWESMPDYVTPEVASKMNDYFTGKVSLEDTLSQEDIFPNLFVETLLSSKQTGFEEVVEIDEEPFQPTQPAIESKETYTSTPIFQNESEGRVKGKDGKLQGTPHVIRTQEELENNPLVQFINDFYYQTNLDKYKENGEITFKAFTGKDLHAILTAPTNVGTDSIVDLNWNNTEWFKNNASTDTGLSLVLVDKFGNPKTVEVNGINYLIRFGRKGEDLVEGVSYKLDRENTTSGLVAVLPKSVQKRYTSQELALINKESQGGLKVATGSGNGIQQGSVFYDIKSKSGKGIKVKLNTKHMNSADYSKILSRILTIKDVDNLSRIATAWNYLVKHNKQKKEKDGKKEFFYNDTMYVADSNFVGVGDMKEGLILSLPDSNTELFFPNGTNKIYKIDKSFGRKVSELNSDKSGVLIEKYVANRMSKVDKDTGEKVGQRRFSPILKKPNSEDALFTVVDTASYLDILGINEDPNAVITSYDLLAQYSWSRIHTKKQEEDDEVATPVIYNIGFQVIPKTIVYQEKLTKEEEFGIKTVAEKLVVDEQTQEIEAVKTPSTVVKKSKPLVLDIDDFEDDFFAKKKDILQLGEQISQSDIDNLKKIFPSLEGREIRLLAATAQTNYWGKFSNAGITLLESATKGTLYHEAWHEFSQWYLPTNVKDDLYKKVQQITGIKDRREQEEFLAEQFERFKLGEPIHKGLDSYFKKEQHWFKKILNFLRNIFTGGSYTTIYKEFKKLGLVIDGKKKLKTFRKEWVEFDSLNKALEINGIQILSNQELIQVTKFFDSIIFSFLEGNNKALNKKNNIDPNTSYYLTNSIYSPDYINSEQIKQNQYKYLAEVIQRKLEQSRTKIEENQGTLLNVLNNFVPVFNLYLKKTPLPFKTGQDLIFNEDGTIKEDEENIEGTRNKSNLIEGNENSITKDMSKDVKAIFASLRKPKLGNPEWKNVKTLEDYKRIKEDNKVSKDFYEVSEFGLVFNRVEKDATIIKTYQLLNGMGNYTDMYNKLIELAPKHPEFWELVDKLPSVEDLRSGSTKAREIATKFESNKRYMLPYQNVFINIEQKGNDVNILTSVTEAEKNNFETIKIAMSNLYERKFLKKDLNLVFLANRLNSTEKNIIKGTIKKFEDLYTSGFLNNVTTHDNDSKGSFLDLGKNEVQFDSVAFAKNYIAENLNNLQKSKAFELYFTLLEFAGISLSQDTVENILSNEAERVLFLNNMQSLFLKEGEGFKKVYNTINQLKTIEEFKRTDDTNIYLINGKKVLKDNIPNKIATLNVFTPFMKIFGTRGVGLDEEFKVIQRLLNKEAKFTNKQYTTVIRNANGDQVNVMFLPNGITQVLTALNDTSLTSIFEIVEKYPYVEFLNAFKIKGSLLYKNPYLDLLFDKKGNRRKIDDKRYHTLTWNNMGGSVSTYNGQELDEGTSTKLNEIDKIFQNLVMDSFGSRLKRTGDKATETIFTHSNEFPMLSVEDSRNTFTTFLKNEVTLAYRVYKENLNKGFKLKEFTYLTDYISTLFNEKTELEDVLKIVEEDGQVWEKIKEFIKNDKIKFTKELKELGIYDLKINDKFVLLSLLSDNRVESDVPTTNTNKKVDTVSFIELESKLEAFIVKKHIDSISQNNLFYGYTGMFKDMFKRNSHITSSGIALSTDKNIISNINQSLRYSFGVVQKLRENKTIANKINKINDSNLTPDEKYQAIKVIVDENSKDINQEDFTINENNPTYKIDFVSADKIFEIDGVELQGYNKESSNHSDIRKSFQKSKELYSEPNLTLKEGKYLENNTADAQAWCSFDFYRTFKILVAKWSPEQEYIWQMLSMGINVTEYQGKPITTFFPPVKPQYAGYTPDKSDSFTEQAFDKMSFLPFIPTVYEGTAFQIVGEYMAKNNIAYLLSEDAFKLDRDVAKGKQRFFANLKEQINIEAVDHTEAISPSQLRQIIAGFGKDSNGEWIPGFEKLVTNFNKNNEDLREILEKELFDELGMVDGVINKAKLDELIKRELTSRNYSTAVSDAVQIVDGKFVYNLETVLAKQTITNLLTSIVNRRLVRVLVNGDMLVQVSSHFLTDDSLLFYKIGKINGVEQTLPASVKIGLRGDSQWKKLLNFKINGETIGTRERLNKELAKIKEKYKEAANRKEDTEELIGVEFTQEERDFIKAVTITGVRIPTQGLNSMEVFFIEEFLDDKVGGLIVVPEEITTKAGSDFDIDKLVMMYPELDPDTIKKQVHNNIVESIKNLILHPARYQELVYPNDTDIIGATPLENKVGDKKVPDKDGSVNKIQTKVYYEMVRSNRSEYPSLFSNGELKVKEFLDWVLLQRNNELNTAYANANTMVAENAKFKNGSGTKPLVGVSALSVTQVNLLSNHDINIKTEYMIESRKVKLPLQYFTLNYRNKNIQIDENNNDIFKFSTVTDNHKLKAFNEDLSIGEIESQSHLKRTIAEQTVNPMVDSLNDKNPISQININNETLATVSFMTTYLGITTEIAYYLVNQPLVLEHIKNKQVNKSKFANKIKEIKLKREKGEKYRKGDEKLPTQEKLLKKKIKEFAERKDPQNMGELTKNYKKRIKSTVEKLEGRFLNLLHTESSENMFDKIGKKFVPTLEDLQHLHNFIVFERTAEVYRKLQSATNWSTNTQQSFAEAKSKIREYKNFTEPYITNIDGELVENKNYIDVFTNVKNLGEQSVVKNFRVQDINTEMLSQFFTITNSKLFEEIQSELQQKINSGSQEKFGRVFTNDFYSYLVQNSDIFNKDIKGLTGLNRLATEMFSNKMDSPYSQERSGVIDRLIALKELKDEDGNYIYANNEFIQSVYRQSEGTLDNIVVRPLTKEIDTTEAISDGIDELLEQDYNLGMQVIFLGLIQDGINKSPISWSHFIKPEHYAKLIEKAFDDFSSKSIDEQATEILQYSYLFFKNNPSLLEESLTTTHVNSDGSKVYNVDMLKVFYKDLNWTGISEDTDSFFLEISEDSKWFQIPKSTTPSFKFKNYIITPGSRQYSELFGNAGRNPLNFESLKSNISYLSTPSSSESIAGIEDSDTPFNNISQNTETSESTIPSEVILLQDNFDRKSVEKDSNYLYLFTDNAKRTSGKVSINLNSWYVKKYGKGNYPSMTQAVIRGLNNAFPITTMIDDNRTQWNDSKFEEYKTIIDDEIDTIKKALVNFKGLKISGQQLFGKGKISNMKESAPKIWNYLNSKLLEIGIDNTGDKVKIVESTTPSEDTLEETNHCGTTLS